MIGYVLRKFAPHDTYKIYKTGSKIRVDGTLIGIEKNSSAMIPEWKRGDFSLLYDGTHQQSRIYLAFHKTSKYPTLTLKSCLCSRGVYRLDRGEARNEEKHIH